MSVTDYQDAKKTPSSSEELNEKSKAIGLFLFAQIYISIVSWIFSTISLIALPMYKCLNIDTTCYVTGFTSYSVIFQFLSIAMNIQCLEQQKAA